MQVVVGAAVSFTHGEGIFAYLTDGCNLAASYQTYVAGVALVDNRYIFSGLDAKAIAFFVLDPEPITFAESEIRNRVVAGIIIERHCAGNDT